VIGEVEGLLEGAGGDARDAGTAALFRAFFWPMTTSWLSFWVSSISSGEKPAMAMVMQY
jgi:hypothetical protein